MDVNKTLLFKEEGGILCIAGIILVAGYTGQWQIREMLAVMVPRVWQCDRDGEPPIAVKLSEVILPACQIWRIDFIGG